MAHHDSIDLTTLETVHRLLRDTDFATVDDLLTRSGPARLAESIERLPAPSTAPMTANLDSTSPAPLPRRR